MGAAANPTPAKTASAYERPPAWRPMHLRRSCYLRIRLPLSGVWPNSTREHTFCRAAPLHLEPNRRREDFQLHRQSAYAFAVDLQQYHGAADRSGALRATHLRALEL